MTIAEQIRQVRLNINQYCLESGRQPQEVRLLAVSKTHPATAIQAAYESTITEFGESYLQEAIDKIQLCQHLPIVWHFIGPLQSNKTRTVAENFDWVQSVDREKILIRLSEQRPSYLPALQVCIQANLFNEPQKQGANAEELIKLLAIADKLPNINLRGLMVIPPIQDKLEAQMRQCAQVFATYQLLQQQFPQMDTLSMGMSNDIQAAIHHGSSMVRVGTAIFGTRSNAKQ